MGGIQHPHWHIASAHLASLSCSPQCHYLQRQCHHFAPYFSFMYEGAHAITHSTRRGAKGTDLEQFMFGISVIESHSYIKERNLHGVDDINVS